MKITYETSSGIVVVIEAANKMEADSKFVEQLIESGYLERSDEGGFHERNRL